MASATAWGRGEVVEVPGRALGWGVCDRFYAVLRCERGDLSELPVYWGS